MPRYLSARLPVIEKIEHFGFVLPKPNGRNYKLYIALQSRCRGWPAQSNHPLDTMWLARSRALAACLRAASKARIANLRRDNARRS